MRERRHLARRGADEVIQVWNINTDQPLGQIVNLSREGLMLIGHQAVESHLIFQLELRLQQPRRGHSRLLLGAESQWCSETSEPGHYWTGYQIIDISLGTAEIIEDLLNDWASKSDLP
jgi:hypothetical protein